MLALLLPRSGRGNASLGYHALTRALRGLYPPELALMLPRSGRGNASPGYHALRAPCGDFTRSSWHGMLPRSGRGNASPGYHALTRALRGLGCWGCTSVLSGMGNARGVV